MFNRLVNGDANLENMFNQEYMEKQARSIAKQQVKNAQEATKSFISQQIGNEATEGLIGAGMAAYPMARPYIQQGLKGLKQQTVDFAEQSGIKQNIAEAGDTIGKFKSQAHELARGVQDIKPPSAVEETSFSNRARQLLKIGGKSEDYDPRYFGRAGLPGGAPTDVMDFYREAGFNPDEIKLPSNVSLVRSRVAQAEERSPLFKRISSSVDQEVQPSQSLGRIFQQGERNVNEYFAAVRRGDQEDTQRAIQSTRAAQKARENIAQAKRTQESLPDIGDLKPSQIATQSERAIPRVVNPSKAPVSASSDLYSQKLVPVLPPEQQEEVSPPKPTIRPVRRPLREGDIIPETGKPVPPPPPRPPSQKALGKRRAQQPIEEEEPLPPTEVPKYQQSRGEEEAGPAEEPLLSEEDLFKQNPRSFIGNIAQKRNELFPEEKEQFDNKFSDLPKSASEAQEHNDFIDNLVSNRPAEKPAESVGKTVLKDVSKTEAAEAPVEEAEAAIPGIGEVAMAATGIIGSVVGAFEARKQKVEEAKQAAQVGAQQVQQIGLSSAPTFDSSFHSS